MMELDKQDGQHLQKHSQCMDSGDQAPQKYCLLWDLREQIREYVEHGDVFENQTEYRSIDRRLTGALHHSRGLSELSITVS